MLHDRELGAGRIECREGAGGKGPIARRAFGEVVEDGFVQSRVWRAAALGGIA